MDSLFDSIIPLLIILFYLFGNVFRKKGKDKEAPPPTEPSYPQPEDEPQSLREEIRRRFEERARQLRGETEPEPPPPSPDLDPVLQPEPPSVSPVEATLLAQRTRLDELRRTAVDIKSQQTSTKDPYEWSRAASSTSAAIRRRLNSRQTVREAIVLMEVLGTPVSLRKLGEEMRPNFGS